MRRSCRPAFRPAYLEGTDIERCAAAVGGHEALVELDGHLAHLAEELFGHGFHHDAFGRRAYAAGVFFKAENAYLAIFAAEGFGAFEYLLAIVQGSGGNMDVDGLGLADFNLAPFAVLECAAHIVVGGDIAERERTPVNFFSHYTI